MNERPAVKDDGSHNGHLVATEARITVQTPQGPQKCPAGTMFHIVLREKLPVGVTVDGFTSTEESGYSNVRLHWALADESRTYENEGSLRRKIASAEIRQWWVRSLIAGMSVGVSIEFARRSIDCLLAYFAA